MKILLVEDDRSMLNSMTLLLKSEGNVVTSVELGEDCIDLVKTSSFDIIVLDLNLPDMSGFEVLKSLRNSKFNIPIMILSGLSNYDDKVKGLLNGADDYMTKPFNKDEFIARIQAIVRRSSGFSQSIIEVDNKLSIDLERHTAMYNGHWLDLTKKEYTILELLARKQGKTISKVSFLDQLYDGNDEPNDKIIDVFVCKLRKKLEEASGKNYIETIWGRGYSINSHSS